MTSSADQAIDALRTGHDKLATIVNRLRPDDLTRPSGASEWDVSQVLSHLGSGAQIGLRALTTALPEGPSISETNQQVWARWDAMAPTDRASGFLKANEALVARYEALDSEARATVRIDLGFLPQPADIATAGAFRLAEFAFHSWDVRVAFEPDAALDPEALEPLLDHVRRLVGFVGHAEVLAGRQASITVRTTDPERAFGLEFRDSVSLVDEPDRPDGVLTAPAESWLRLVVGRLSAERTPPSVRLTGDLISLDDLRRVFPGF